jgi:hypothetical protein
VSTVLDFIYLFIFFFHSQVRQRGIVSIASGCRLDSPGFEFL